MQVLVLTGTCVSTCEEFCVFKKHKFITNALERDTYLRFLSAKSSQMDDVFFLCTFTPRKKHGSGLNGMITVQVLLLCWKLQDISMWSCIKPRNKQNAVGRGQSESRHVNWLYDADRLEKFFLGKSCSRVIYSERDSVNKSSVIEHWFICFEKFEMLL